MDDILSDMSGPFNYLYGGEGNDRITINTSHSFGYGEAGNDILTLQGEGIASIYGGDGDDILNVNSRADSRWRQWK